MIDERKLLRVVILDYQNRERVRRDDWSFDAWEDISRAFGHKNSTTLRKMTEPKGRGNGAKLGFEDALIVMERTEDYRLLKYAFQEVKRRKQVRQEQLTLFDEPLRTLEALG